MSGTPDPSTDNNAAWREVASLFNALVDASPSTRERELAARDAHDPWIAQQVRALLAAHDAADERFDLPALSRLSADQHETLMPPDPLLAMPRVGTYHVLRKIGEGGMGAVYEAERADAEFHQRVVIKTIARGAESSVIVSRFRRERQILAQLQHPNIVGLLDGGVTDNGTPYFVMEYVDGQTIDAYCASKQLTIVQRLDLMQQVCRAVQHAHQHLVVHRDLKPHNVLVSADGVVKLLDFGVARLTDPVAGDGTLNAVSTITRDFASPLTLAYASPEQLRGEPVSTASDVYSLGVLLYELLAGVPPYARDGRNLAQFTELVLHTEPASPSTACTDIAAQERRAGDRARLAKQLSGELDAIVLMAIRKDIPRRYASVEALSLDLQRYLRGQPVSARPDTLSYRATKFVARHRWPVALTSSLVVVALAAGVTIARQSAAAAREGARSERIAEFLRGVLGSADAFTLSRGVARVGPGASIGALLNAAAQRVPSEFADDPAVRARLYQTIATSFLAQGRLRDAAQLLDSTLTLSRAAYSERSDVFVTASLDAATVALYRNHTHDALAFVAQAMAALTASGNTESELYARALKDRSSIELVQANYAGMAADAEAALALEARRTSAPTLIKAVAINRLGTMAALRDTPQRAESLYEKSMAMLREIDATHNIEFVDVLFNAASRASQFANRSRADSLVSELERLAYSTFGPDSREAALASVARVYAALAHGDTVVALRASARASRIIDSIPEVIALSRTLVHYLPAAIAFARKDWATSDTAIREATKRALQRSIADGGGEYFGYLEATLRFQLGATHLSLGALDSAHAQLSRAAAVYDTSGVHIVGLRNEIHVFQARIAAIRGDTAGVSRELSALPPPQAAGVRAYLARESATSNRNSARAPRQPRNR